MKIIKEVTQKEVFEHWKKIEGFSENDFRSDIRNPLPTNIKWYLASIEPTDVQKLYIISSDDWRDISGNTFLVLKIIERLNISSSIATDIKNKIDYLNSGKIFDTQLIIVADSLPGSFTLIEGNKRAVALLSKNLLVGKNIYLGISSAIRGYWWTRYTYRN